MKKISDIKVLDIMAGKNLDIRASPTLISIESDPRGCVVKMGAEKTVQDEAFSTPDKNLYLLIVANKEQFLAEKKAAKIMLIESENTLSRLEMKAKKYDEISDAVAEIYDRDEHDADLGDIGEIVASKLGYLD